MTIAITALKEKIRRKELYIVSAAEMMWIYTLSLRDCLQFTCLR